MGGENGWPSGWRESVLEDCMSAIIDYRGKTPKKTAFGIPLVTAKIVKDGRIETPSEFIAASEYDSWMRRGLPEPGDVVMTTEAPLGEVAQLDDKKVALAQRLITLRGKRDLLDNTYLRYLIQSAFVQSQLIARASGTTVLGIKQSELRKVSLPIPPLAEQKAIAHILGMLDEKIELNRRMNGTLEGIARAVFKSWFVDFDPVRAKLDGRQPAGMDSATAALFPDSFEESEAGKVPRGWKIQPIGEYVTLQRGKTYKSSLKGQPGPYLLGLASIERNGGFRSDKLVTYGGECPENLLVSSGDMYVSLKDVTQSADLLGSVAKVPSWIEVGRMTQDTVKLVFSPNAPSRHLVYRTLLEPDYREHCKSHATGTTNLGLSREDFLGYPLLVPPTEVQQRFDELINQLDSKTDVNVRESQTLSTLRDTLLPKLLSGEIRVGEAREMVGEG